MSPQPITTTTRGPIPLAHVDRILPDRRPIGERETARSDDVDPWGLAAPTAELVVAAAQGIGRVLGWMLHR
jgi:hypothetical protein